MSNHNRKRKHRGPHTASSRPNHYRNNDDDHPDLHNTQGKFPAFLSHHDAYQASLAPLSSSNNLSGFEIETPQERELSQRQDPFQALYIQAYEADIIRGPTSRTAAESLEVVEYMNQAFNSEGDVAGSGSTTTSRFKSPLVNVKVVPKIGSALIQLQLNGVSRSQSSSSEHGSFASGAMRVFDEDDESVGANLLATPPIAPQSTPKTSIWVDRYDARLLLDAFPTPTAHTHTSSSPTSQPRPAPSSPTGWSDLSSDAEDTFFFDPEETEDFRREKRRRLLERTREERLKARREEDGDVADEETRKEEEEEVWGGSDEEPDQTQKDLMSRTATHLLSSPNPAQLEMRILANHGRDRRFAFLRGRWSKAWGLIKAKARVELAKAKQEQEQETQLKKTPEKKISANAGLGLLASYGTDSEEEDEDQKEEENEKVEEKENDGLPAREGKEVKVPDKVVGVVVDEDEVVKEARRKRLKAWSEQRKAAREKAEDTG